jgi:hypothetical protein
MGDERWAYYYQPGERGEGVMAETKAFANREHYKK